VQRDAVIDATAYRVSTPVKVAGFVGAVITLSWFFQGCRDCAESVTFPHVFTMFAGITLTLVLLMVQGYWVYIEEKLKGTLRKRIGLYERIYERSALYKRINGDTGERS